MMINRYMDLEELRDRVDSYGYVPREELVAIRSALVERHYGRDTDEISETEWQQVVEAAIGGEHDLDVLEREIDEGIDEEADRSRA